jgi:hypothetical protein
VNVIFCEKRRGEREKKREKEREKKERKRREKIWKKLIQPSNISLVTYIPSCPFFCVHLKE